MTAVGALNKRHTIKGLHKIDLYLVRAASNNEARTIANNNHYYYHEYYDVILISGMCRGPGGVI